MSYHKMTWTDSSHVWILNYFYLYSLEYHILQSNFFKTQLMIASESVNFSYVEIKNK